MLQITIKALIIIASQNERFNREKDRSHRRSFDATLVNVSGHQVTNTC